MATASIVYALRRAEYTGDNRCLPCTAVNLCLVAVLAALGTALWAPAGLAIAVAGLATVWLRGYVLPGTPELTRRYLPDTIARYFGDPHDETSLVGITTDTRTPPDTHLTTAGILTPEDDDYVLTADARSRWTDELNVLRNADTDAALVERVADLLETTPDQLTVEPDTESARVSVHADGQLVGQWISEAAFVADAAAAPLARDNIPEWADIPPGQRGTILVALRVFVPSCPTCGGPVDFDIEQHAGCCWSRDAYVLACTVADCGDAIFTIDQATADASIDDATRTQVTS